MVAGSGTLWRRHTSRCGAQALRRMTGVNSRADTMGCPAKEVLGVGAPSAPLAVVGPAPPLEVPAETNCDRRRAERWVLAPCPVDPADWDGVGGGGGGSGSASGGFGGCSPSAAPRDAGVGAVRSWPKGAGGAARNVCNPWKPAGTAAGVSSGVPCGTDSATRSGVREMRKPGRAGSPSWPALRPG